MIKKQEKAKQMEPKHNSVQNLETEPVVVGLGDVPKKTEKKQKKKKKNIFRLLNIKNLQTEINGYGYHYSIRSFFIQLVIAFAVIFIAGIVCDLNWKPIVLLLLIGTVLTPYIILEQFRFLYEEKRFVNATNYMTQMIYSFKKTPKILNALEDTQKVIDEKGAILVEHAIDYIKAGKYKDNLYKEALAEIEEEYGCDRLMAIHGYMEHVERVGGEYRHGMDVILSDLQGWTERTYSYQKDRKAMKLKSVIAIVLCIVICALLTNLLPEQFSISGYPIYQICTTVLLGIFIFLFALIQSKLNGSWLKETSCIKDSLIDTYKLQANGKMIKRAYLQVSPLLAALAIGIIYFSTHGKISFALAFGLLFILMCSFPQIQKRTAKSILKKEFIKTFPDWIRQLSLNLQMQNVYVAIKETTPNMPYVLRTELENLIAEIDADPVTVKPYNDFLATYDIPEVTTNMSMIYALNKYGRADAEKQINSLIKRNAKMVEKSEILKNKDEIGITGFALMVIPEILTVIKMLIDMTLMLMTFLSITQTTF